jgi:hypothetical protein
VVGNPLKYIDPTGHMYLDGGSAPLSSLNRGKMLQDFATQLTGIDAMTPMERFQAFVAYASSLYSGEETDQFMVDVTAVLHGHKYDTQGDDDFWEKRDDHTSGVWIDMSAFHAPVDLEGGGRDAGWSEQYKDDSGNQLYHFWFYVATAYFDGARFALGGNFFHDGYGAVGPIGRAAMRAWNDAGDGLMPRLTGRKFDMDPGGVSKADYDLGFRGAELGVQIRESRIPPSGIRAWLRTNLSE